MQSKLLRVLQEQEIERLGSTHTIKIDVRVMTATNRDLAHMVEHGQFRSDLYYRITCFRSWYPPFVTEPRIFLCLYGTLPKNTRAS